MVPACRGCKQGTEGGQCWVFNGICACNTIIRLPLCTDHKFSSHLMCPQINGWRCTRYTAAHFPDRSVPASTQCTCAVTPGGGKRGRRVGENVVTPKLAITMAFLPFSIGWAAAPWQQPANQKKSVTKGQMFTSQAM